MKRIVRQKGKPIAALVAIDAGDEESLSLSANRKFLDVIRRSSQRLETEGDKRDARSRSVAKVVDLCRASTEVASTSRVSNDFGKS